MAVRVDASGDSLIRTTSLPTASTCSACAWVYLVADRNDYQNFISIHHSGFGSQDIFLSTANDGTTLHFFDGSADLTGVNMSTGTWYWIGFTRTNTSRALYYSALTDTTITRVTDSSTQTITATPTSLYLMNDIYTEWVSGRIAAAKFWSGVALSQAEMEQEKSRILPNTFGGLYGFWPMFPGSGERARDYSGNGYNLTEGGTLTDEDHPPVSWGGRVLHVSHVAAAGGIAIPVIVNHLRQQRIS